jgi:CHAT domain-containing protein
MTAFYRGLAAGQTKRSALRQAQQAVLNQGGGAAHPYFWASFFLVGNGGPL